jgi:hypothetical protein
MLLLAQPAATTVLLLPKKGSFGQDMLSVVQTAPEQHEGMK